MKIKVACIEKEYDRYKKYVPATRYYDCYGYIDSDVNAAYRPYYINESRIVFFVPEENLVWIDDGSSDGVVFIVDDESAELITYFLE